MLAFFFFFDLFNFDIGLADLEMILADIWTSLLETEWWIFFGSSALEFYNFPFFCFHCTLVLLFQVTPKHYQNFRDAY